MKKVDKINYDVVGAYRERREKQLEEELPRTVVHLWAVWRG